MQGGERYFSISNYFKQTFGEKTIKLSLDAGFTCPNRDGTLGTGGCAFCSSSGSGEFASSISEQIELLSEKWPHARHIAYFQNHTNTYAPVPVLRKYYYDALSDSRIDGIAIATRPDCLPPEILDLLAELNRRKPVWVELGLQTIHEATAARIRRGYPLSVFDEAVRDLHAIGVEVIVHLILGLPGETAADMEASSRYVGWCGAEGVKLHLLHYHLDLVISIFKKPLDIYGQIYFGIRFNPYTFHLMLSI